MDTDGEERPDRMQNSSPHSATRSRRSFEVFPDPALMFRRYAGGVALYKNAPADASSGHDTLNHLRRFRYDTVGNLKGPLARLGAFRSTTHSSCSRHPCERCVCGREVKHEPIHSCRDHFLSLTTVTFIFCPQVFVQIDSQSEHSCSEVLSLQTIKTVTFF